MKPEKETTRSGKKNEKIKAGCGGCSSVGSSQDLPKKRGSREGSRRQAVVLDVSGLSLPDLIRELFANALCAYGLRDPQAYPDSLTDKEIETLIAERKEIHVLHGRHLGGLNLGTKKLNASLYDRMNRESEAAKDAGRKVKLAQAIVQELQKKQEGNKKV